LAHAPLASFQPSHPLMRLFLQLLSRGRVDAPTLQAEVAQAPEAAATVEAAHIAAVLVVETSAQEAATAWDSAIHHIKDVEDRATLAEREA
jgi:G:T/U-mismatch repair DNA glycosylase